MFKKDIAKDGVTTFAQSPSTSYRYVIKLTNDRMSIWMEDCSSKNQWCTGDMLKEDYVTSANTIPDADPVDYVKCFYDCLECKLNSSCPVQRTLTELTGGTIQLNLILRIPFLRSTWVAKYRFDLKPVSVSQIDVLESKFRDQNDELVRLRNELNAVEAVPFIKLEADHIGSKSRLQWNKVDCAEFVVDSDDGKVKARAQGSYSIRGVINCAPINHNQSVMILKNGECIQRNYCAYTGRDHFVSISLDCIALLEENDTLTITSNCSAVTTSYLSIVSIVRS